MVTDTTTGNSPSGEATANCQVTPYLHAWNWWDNQLYASAPDVTRWEGSYDSTRITGGSITFEVWPTSWATEAAQVLIPFAMAIGTIPFLDAVGNGNPWQFIPTQIPNLFYRDWGRVGGGTTAATQPPGDAGMPNLIHNRGYRLIHRWFTTIDATDIAYGRGNPVQRHDFRLKPFTVRNAEALCIFTSAYCTWPTSTLGIGFKVSGTFGYIHRTAR